MAPEPDHVMRPRVYDELEASARAGLDPCAIAATAANYYWDETLNRLRAKLYDAPFSVRLLCTAIAGPEGGDALRDAAAEACAEFTAALPPGFRTYQNPKASYHSTVFHTANPSDPRPADEAFIAAELKACAALVAATPALHVEVDRVVLASSGVLLVLLNEQGLGPSPTDDLRVRCRAAFPDAPKKQATFVMHVSLCRVETAPAADDDAWLAVMQRVDSLSARLRGAKATLRTIWHVQEPRIAVCGDLEEGCVVEPMATAPTTQSEVKAYV
jgi:hypothetical protein